VGVIGPAERPLTPLVFLERARRMFGDRTAVIDGDRRFTYEEMYDRVARRAAALRAAGLSPGDRVAVLAPNTCEMLELHYSVPAGGLVLLALNVRLRAGELAEIVAHAGARLLLFDDELADTADAIPGIENWSMADLAERAAVVDPLAEWNADERGLLALNYTSGTTGRPKGVMYHHRGAYVQSLAMAYHGRLAPGSVHLWTLPMFHCNGWCFTWAVTAAAATHLCLRKIDPDLIWRHLRHDRVTSLNAAPTVLTMFAWHAAADSGPAPRRVLVGTGGAPPSPTLLERLDALNFETRHLYGLTETFGPVVACDWQPEWNELPAADRARLAARQGSGNISGAEVRVASANGEEHPADGNTPGEVQIRGNNVMLGYYRDPEATDAAFAPGGWFRTGDIGVLHPDGYIELRDRAKDVIISGGENIASIEVEQAVASHPAVLEVAVVSMPDDRWGEVPLAHVTLRPGREATAEEIIDHVQGRIARFKAPRRVVFGELPKTSTGKVQKFQLREAAWAGHETRIR
jgi:fatty-acyl-CoA synthase